MTFKKYKLTLKHDHGKINLITVATSRTSAVRSILAAERAPFSAITKIQTLQTIYQTPTE